MELLELRKTVFAIFGISEAGALESALWTAIRDRNEAVFDAVAALDPEMDEDLMQPIFQYYLADRKGKMQDFTPPTLAGLMARLAGDSGDIVDMCAGTGALTIMAWVRNSQRHFELLEADPHVLPFLLFNLALRNMDAHIAHVDILTGEVFADFSLTRGEKYSVITETRYKEDQFDKSCKQSAVQHALESVGQGSLLAM